jgi:hypothetical protein
MIRNSVRLAIFFFFLALIPRSYSQEITRDVYNDVYKYSITVFPTDFREKFQNSDDKKDFRRLRGYLFDKQDLLQSVQAEKNKFYFGHSIEEIGKNLTYYRFAAAEYAKDIKLIKGEKTISVDTNYIYDVSNPSLKQDPNNARYRMLDSTQLAYYFATYLKDVQDAVADSMHSSKLDSNVVNIKSDIISATNQIDQTLSPEIKQQEFRANITLYFTILLGAILIAFFILLYNKTDKETAKELIGPTGLQFITLFVLIIAVILFGVLGILERSELSAILSGISGYILGKGVLSNRGGNTGQRNSGEGG